MKKLISIFLLICLVAPVTGTYLWLKYEIKSTKREVKRQMIVGMDKKELVLLKFTKAEKESKLNWKHSKEFEYKGQMYDVVETKIDEDTIYYRCWWDNAETKLSKKLSNLVSDVLGNNQQNKENNKRLVQFFKSLYHTNTYENPEHFQLEGKTYFINNSRRFISFCSPPLVPPPQLA